MSKARETKTAAAARDSKSVTSKSDVTSESESDEEEDTLTLNRETLDALAKTIATAVATAMAKVDSAKTIATAVATAMATAGPKPYTITHSNALDPYDTASFDMATKEGKYQWAVMTRMQDGWKQLTCSTESASILMDLFKDRQTQFGLDILLKIPTEGNGKAEPAPRNLAGIDLWDADLKEYKSLLVDIHSVSFDHVRAWSSWFYGGEEQELAVSKDMLIHAINPNKTGNQGLVNRHKIRLRRLSGALHFIAKNHIKRNSYNSFYPRKELFLYKDESTGRDYVCGVIFLKMMMEVMKPHLVVDHRAKETELEKMTLASFANNARTLLTSMQEKRNEIDQLRKDGVKFDEQRFLTLIFDRLTVATCTDFKADVKAEKRKWIMDSTSVDSTTLIASFISLYINYKSTGEWDAEVIDKDAVIVALAAQVKFAKDKAGKFTIPRKDGKQQSTTGGRTPLPDWRITKKGNTYSHEGTKYDWCTRHGPNNRNNEKKSSGMYMPHPHNHDEWAAARKAKQAACEAKISEGTPSKRKATEDDKSSAKRAMAKSNLKISKSFQSALVSKLQISDAEIQDVINCAMENAITIDDTDEEASK